MSFADDNQIQELKVAAERGDDVAQTNLGLYYEMGYGVKKNPDKAIYWWKKAAEQGNVVAQFNLGNCYYSGKGVKKNLKKAVYWWEGLRASRCGRLGRI